MPHEHGRSILIPQPARRSRLRLRLGGVWFTWKRRLAWYCSATRHAAVRSNDFLEYPIFSHSSPLVRPLQKLEMRLQENKKRNLELAAGKIDGLLLEPGETFSFWRTVGKPTRRRGYLEGLVLSQGGLRAGIGGGLCQLSNLIYWMALHTPLQVVERRRHSYDVFPDAERTQPFGSGATVAYNYVDLQIHNPTEARFQLRIWLDGTHLRGEWRSGAPTEHAYAVFERNHRICSQPWGGYTRHNEIYRTVTRLDTRETREEFITANDALMLYSPMLPEAGGA
jgi:vancomycin resistance protein VanW